MGSASGPVIIIVLVVVALVIAGGVVLVARAKGMMCFGEKAEQLDEEKEAFDDAEKGKLAGETEKSKTPDKNPLQQKLRPKTKTRKTKRRKNPMALTRRFESLQKNTVRLIYRQLKNLESRVGENQ